MDSARYFEQFDDSIDDIFIGPVTKREIVSKLKYYNLLTDELVKPLSKFKDNDALDDFLISYYDDIINDQGYTHKYSQETSDSVAKLVAPNSPKIEIISPNVSYKSTADESVIIINDEDSSHLEDSLETDSYKLISPVSFNTSELENSSQMKNMDSSCSTDNKNSEGTLNATIKYEVDTENWSSQERVEFNNTGDEAKILKEEKKEYSTKTRSENGDSSNISKTWTNEQPPRDEKQRSYGNLTATVNNIEDVSSVKSQNVDSEFNLKIEQISDDEEAINGDLSTNITDVENCMLNGTLEEMEMLMKFGEMYMKQAKENSVASSKLSTGQTGSSFINNAPASNLENFSYDIESFNISTEKITNSTQISVSSSTTSAASTETRIPRTPSYQKTGPSPKLSAERPKKSASSNKENEVKRTLNPNINTPVNYRKLKTPIVSKTFTVMKTPTTAKTSTVVKTLKTPVLKPANNSDSQFKVPVKIPSLKKSPTFRNVVSPISIYIKNSPKVPLVKNVVKKIDNISAFKGDKKSSDDIVEASPVLKPVLPVRTYKPASKNIFMAKEAEPALPSNVRKLIKGSLNPEVIKHVGRVKGMSEISQPTTPNPLSSDITVLSTSTSSEATFNVSSGLSEDVSVYISKNAARTNYLQKI